MHRASSDSYIICWTSFISPRAPLTSSFPNQFPRPSKHKRKEQKTNKKKAMTTNNNTTPQTKWHGHGLDINKTTNQAQTNHKIPKAQNSIPMGFQCLQRKAQPKPSSRFHGNIFCHETPCIILPKTHNCQCINKNNNITVTLPCYAKHMIL